MWTRAELKARAKNILKGSYWKAFLVSIVMGLVSSGGSYSSSKSGSNAKSSGMLGSGREEIVAAVLIGLFVGAIVFLIIVAIKILVGYQLEVGGRRYFIQAAQGDVNMGYLGYGFNGGRYFNIIKTMFWKNLMIFLWTLLLIIPGIIKQYAYMMVPYILADNPDIGSKRALELSDQMTKGHKFDMFILYLSFIGWYLLGMLACVVGMVFVTPYQHATEAELYLFLRGKAIENGYCDYRELNLEKKYIEME